VKHLKDSHKVVKGDTIIGTSLGGIVAGKISDLIPLKRIFLIGAAKMNKEVHRGLDIL
jgi:esterase/lipase